VELLEPDIPGDLEILTDYKYQAGGVLAQDGCVYFAPLWAGRVLRITAAGSVELLEPEIPGVYRYQVQEYWLKMGVSTSPLPVLARCCALNSI